MNNILLEELSKAIGARQFIQFTYGSQTYLLEPHDCLCGWNGEKGETQGTKVGWHCFLLDDIKDLKILERRFAKTRPGYDPYDSTMSRIYYRA